MSHSAVHQYLQNEFKKVEGWCIPHLWNCIEPILDYHEEINLRKPVAEIGVYHGKFFIGLIKSVKTAEVSYVFDVFDMQQFNLDGAGEGSKEKLINNLNMCGVDSKTYSLQTVDSMTLDGDYTKALSIDKNYFSLFSVDGCHTPEHTINDMKIAIEHTCPQGLVFIDDYNNPNWPGVQEGVSKFYFNEYSNFIPLLYTCNKLFLCHISYHSIYLDRVKKHLSSHVPGSKVKKVTRFGYETLTILPNNHSTSYIVNNN